MTAKTGGRVELTAGKAQHVDLWRKLALRRDLITRAPPGAAYVPFLGEGDIARELYTDRRIVGVELDPAIAARGAENLRAAQAERPDGWVPLVITGDANTWHADADAGEPFAIADLDSFNNPYLAFEAFWRNAPMTGTVVVFGTDALKMPMLLHRAIALLPSGTMEPSTDRGRHKFWWSQHVRPYLERAVAPARIVADSKYLRAGMLYWGVVVERAGAGPVDGEDPSGPVSPAPSDHTPPAQLVEKSGPSAARRTGLKRATTEHYRAQVAKRVAKRATHTPKITPAQRRAILERDGWICQLCRKPIDPELRHPDRMSQSVDHRRAAEKGGAHDPANFQAAHLGCNAKKRDKLDPAVLEAAIAAQLAERDAADATAHNTNIASVEAALLEAAKSGNVPAAIFWLEHKGGPTWTKTSPATAMLERLTGAPGRGPRARAKHPPRST